MSTSPETISWILDKLHNSPHFATRAMFGEYALYADGRVVALICDDQLFVKIVPASQTLESICEIGFPYPGAKAHYLVAEDQLDSIATLPEILLAISASLPPSKTSNKKRL